MTWDELADAITARYSDVARGKMFGMPCLKAKGKSIAGVWGDSMVFKLDGEALAAALRLEGAEPFDPMGNGRVRSDKVMLPEAFMEETTELRRWIARAFKGTLELPRKAEKPAKKKRAVKAKPRLTRG